MSKSKWTRIEEILSGKSLNNKINLRGWIYRTRSSGNIVFMVVRDASGIIQATIKKGNLPDKNFDDAKKALIESSLELIGVLKEDNRAPGGYEIQVTDLKIINFAPANVVYSSSDQMVVARPRSAVMEATQPRPYRQTAVP